MVIGNRYVILGEAKNLGPLLIINQSNCPANFYMQADVRPFYNWLNLRFCAENPPAATPKGPPKCPIFAFNYRRK